MSTKKPPFGVSYQIVVPTSVSKSREFSDLMKQVLRVKLTSLDYYMLPVYRAKIDDMRRSGQIEEILPVEVTRIKSLFDNINYIHEDLLAYILLALHVKTREAAQESQ